MLLNELGNSIIKKKRILDLYAGKQYKITLYNQLIKFEKKISNDYEFKFIHHDNYLLTFFSNSIN